MDKKELLMELEAVVVYLRVIGAVYPVAPAKTIETVQRAIEYIKKENDNGPIRLAP